MPKLLKLQRHCICYIEVFVKHEISKFINFPMYLGSSLLRLVPSICALFSKYRKCESQLENTVCVPTTSYWHLGSSLLELELRVCAVFGSYRICVPGFENTVCVNYRLLAQGFVFALTVTQCTLIKFLLGGLFKESEIFTE